MVAQHEVIARRHRDLASLIPCAGIAELACDIILHQWRSVDIDLAVRDADAVAGQTDDALDVRFGGIGGIPEHHRIAAVDIAQIQLVGELIDEDALVVGKPGSMLVPSTFTG